MPTDEAVDRLARAIEDLRDFILTIPGIRVARILLVCSICALMAVALQVTIGAAGDNIRDEKVRALESSQTEKQVWMDDQMAVSEAVIKGLQELSDQLKAKALKGADSFVKTAKENQEHARSIVDKSRHQRR